MNDALVALAKRAAQTHNLVPELVCAVCEQESGWNPWAIRFEPAFEQKYIHPAIPTAPTTEQMALAMSWGLMQPMLESVRELGYKGDAAALCDPQTNLDWGCALLVKKLSERNGDVTLGLQHWNGGGNPNYASEVIARMPKYTTPLVPTDSPQTSI